MQQIEKCLCIREYRQILQLSQDGFCDVFNISRSSLCKIEGLKPSSENLVDARREIEMQYGTNEYVIAPDYGSECYGDKYKFNLSACANKHYDKLKSVYKNILITTAIY